MAGAGDTTMKGTLAENKGDQTDATVSTGKQTRGMFDFLNWETIPDGEQDGESNGWGAIFGGTDNVTISSTGGGDGNDPEGETADAFRPPSQTGQGRRSPTKQKKAPKSSASRTRAIYKGTHTSKGTKRKASKPSPLSTKTKKPTKPRASKSAPKASKVRRQLTGKGRNHRRSKSIRLSKRRKVYKKRR